MDFYDLRMHWNTLFEIVLIIYDLMMVGMLDSNLAELSEDLEANTGRTVIHMHEHYVEFALCFFYLFL